MVADVSSMRRIVRRSDWNMAVITRIDLLPAPSPGSANTSLSLLTPIRCRKRSIRYFHNRALANTIVLQRIFLSRAIESAIESTA